MGTLAPMRRTVKPLRRRRSRLGQGRRHEDEDSEHGENGLEHGEAPDARCAGRILVRLDDVLVKELEDTSIADAWGT